MDAMTRPKQRPIPVTSDRAMPVDRTEVEQRRNVYLPFTLAQAVDNAGPDFNLSAAAQWGIRQALNGASDSQHVHDPAQLDRIEQMVTELAEREHQDDRAGWTTRDWIRADWPKAAAVAGLTLLLVTNTAA